MTQTYEKVVEIIAKCTDAEREMIQPNSFLSADLGLDSVDMFDVVFEIEQEFSIDVPLEDWNEENESDEPVEKTDLDLQAFCARIDALIVEQGTA